MLHVLLLILKIIGWILLGILGLLLGLILLVLLVPIRWRIEGAYHGKPRGTARITWLLHMISVRASYEEAFDLSIRLFGFRVFKDMMEQGETEEPAETPSGHGENNTVPEQSPGNLDAGEKPVMRDPIQEQREQADAKTAVRPPDEAPAEEIHTDEARTEAGEASPSPAQKQPFLTRIFEKIKFLFQTVCDKLKFISENYEEVRAFLQDEENQKTVKLIFRQVKALFKHILPRKASGQVTFGFDDPYTTGQVLAAVSMLYAWYGQNIEIVPVFDEAVMEGDLKLKGRIRVGTLLWHCLRVYLNKNFRVQLKRLRNKGGF